MKYHTDMDFLCRLRSIATHRDRFVRRPSVCPSVCHTPIAMFRRRHMHSSECCHYFYLVNMVRDLTLLGFNEQFKVRLTSCVNAFYFCVFKCVVKRKGRFIHLLERIIYCVSPIKVLPVKSD